MRTLSKKQARIFQTTHAKRYRLPETQIDGHAIWKTASRRAEPIERCAPEEILRRPTAIAGSAVFFVLAPGVVAGLLPWLLTHWHRLPLSPYLALRLAGMMLIVAGLAFLIHAFVRFALEGAGTPAPVAPTERLVVGGIYRHVRNPMYVAVLAIIARAGVAVSAILAGPLRQRCRRRDVRLRAALRGAAPGSPLRRRVRGLQKRGARLAAAPDAVARQAANRVPGQ